MLAGELGADYVLFGEPDEHGHRPSTDAIAERLDWWAELFEPPCIGYAATSEEAYVFARAGADFVLVDERGLGRMRAARRRRWPRSARRCGRRMRTPKPDSRPHDPR